MQTGDPSGLLKNIEETAKKTSLTDITGRARPIKEIRQLHRQLDLIRQAYKQLIFSREQITSAFEWLYDNYYILEREGRLVIHELWKSGPLLQAGSATAIRLHAGALCEAAAGAIDAETIEHYIRCAQQVRCFESSELSAMGLMLRAALIAGAAKACGGVSESERLRLLSDAVKTLNFLNTFDFSQIVERQSRLESILARDPSGVYPKMDERSRALYRARIAKIARQRELCETEAAELALRLAQKGVNDRERHVGTYILERELDRPGSGARGRLYLTLLFVLPAVLALVLGCVTGAAWTALLLYLPLWEIVRPLLDYAILKGVPATFLPRMEHAGAIPEEAPTLVVVSALLTSPQKAEEFAKKLEKFYYSNGRGSILFALLADLKEAKLPEQPEDNAVRAAALRQVRTLNRKYGGKFCLFIRSRRYNKTQGGFSGWERKRGAITELVRMIKGQNTSITTFEGDLAQLKKTRYIITLDADTGLLMDTAAEMVSTAMHPLNAPLIENGIVVKGHGILAPRIGVDLESAALTPFSRIMAGAGGVTAYDNASGDTYQDLFGEGIYAGKGIIDVDAFYQVLDHALPENRVLSHDILEGCFLRAGFLSDVEMTDGFPASPAPWFDRLHRWIRGDWQNVDFLRKRLVTGENTPLSGLSRFKLFDNLRRSLTPVLAFLCLIAAAFLPTAPAVLLIAAAFLALAGPGLFSAALAVARGGPSMLSRKYHCRVLPQALDSIAQGALAYLFLPAHATLAADAALRALFRRKSGRKLLEWVTAAESESQKKIRHNKFLQSLRRFWPSFVIGAAFLMLAPQPAAKFAGAFFLITPFVAWLSGRPAPPLRDELSDEDTERLRSYTAAMWRFYEDYVTAQDHFLPPDNFQEAPVSVLAHRTSPTNIGLLLLSTLAARDLKLIDSETMFTRLEKTVETMERLEKWKGHLFNWYDTKTLAPMRPAYVSTVDSGNLLCCLVALREGIRDYRTEDTRAAKLGERITALLDGTDLEALYSKHRRLFHLGYDVEKGRLTEIYYDLLMSEARMTSYYAIAKRIVQKRHWAALGRTLTRQNGYTGPVSWTGTMFEYMMPHLLLPVYEDSMAAEALRFVIFCQQRRVRPNGVPWGISESGFYSFDAALNYQYAAHGVQKLALKRGMDDTLVISPYSTFLALPFCRTAGMKNLKRLENMGLYGRCGFYEAADFSYKRTGGRMAVVKSYMAHHVGMSIVAATNALCDGIMQDRFMRDHEMRSAQDLLCEKIPADAVVFHDVLLREIPEKPGRCGLVREEFESVSPVTPRVNVISNGEYTLLLTDCGASLSMFRGVDVTRRSTDLLRAPSGIFTAASFDGERLCATAAPEYEPSRLIKHRVEFTSHGAFFHARSQNFGIDMRAVLHESMPCEARIIGVENFTQHRILTKLLIYFEPALAKAADEAAHPAFSRLFLHAEYRADTKMLIFSRRARGSDSPSCIAVGFAEHEVDFEFDGDRPLLLTRPGGIASLPGAIDAPFSNRTGALPDAAAALRIKTELPPHARKLYTLLITASSTPEEAAARLIEARRQGQHGLLRAAAGKDADGMEARLAALVLPQILFPVRDACASNLPEGLCTGFKTRGEAVEKNRLGQQGLWQLGISGDFPVVLFHYESEADAERLAPYVKMHRELRLKGIQFDLVVTFREGGDYSRSRFSAIVGCVRGCGCEYLCGARGGIHTVNLERHPDEIRILLIETASHIATDTLRRAAQVPYAMARLRAPTPLPAAAKPNAATFGGFFAQGTDPTDPSAITDSFTVTHQRENPVVPWCHIIASPAFGTLVSDRALGFTWAINARENKLTPWSNDPAADLRGEMLVVRIGSRLYDLCMNARVTYSPGAAVYECEAEGLKFSVRVSLAGRFMAKIVTLMIENGRDREMEVESAYYTEPVLGVSPFTRRHLAIRAEKGLVLLKNPWSPVSGCAFLSVLEGFDTFVHSRSGFLSGNWNDDDSGLSPDPCAAVVAKRRIAAQSRARIRFVLGFAGSAQAAKHTFEHLKEGGGVNRPRAHALHIRVKTPDVRLNALVNTWLYNQFMGARINGRTGFYQCGGAWGFRDQLQDSCAALLTDPEVTRAHILRCAAHQFREGDVMHWWHQLPPRDGGARGVRTRCSDDLLWLPYTVCEYLDKTGDDSILSREIHYLEGPELDKTEEDRYFVPQRSPEKESLYRHCVRAIERALTRGTHGLPLFGSGDWNDGMNLVGIGGTGESVWLAMFEILVLRRFAKVAHSLDDASLYEKYVSKAQELQDAVESTCWNGAWYARGFFDDGHPLGVKENTECRIDLLPQSFAAIAGLPDADRRRQALDSMLGILSDARLHLLRLFDPPFDRGGRNPGYIRSYPPGIRENGGQYTHAAVWGALGLLYEGRTDEAYRILSWISPANRTERAEDARVYRLEPYAIAADIYTNPACEGRGGWSLYTGAAGWYYRTVIEHLLGIRIAPGRITLEPRLPSQWDGFEASLTLDNAQVKLKVTRSGGDKGLTVDSAQADFIPLDGKEHQALLLI